MASERKATSGVSEMRCLVQSWLAEAERKHATAERAGSKTAAAYIKGRADAYRDCLAILHQ